MAKFKATAKLIENFRIVVDNGRTHSVVCDLGPGQGGQDSGPSALELSVMGLAACAAVIFAIVAKQSKIEVTKLEVVTEAEKPAESPKLSGVKLKAYISAKARKQLVESAWRRTEAMCPVLAIFKEQIPVVTELETATTE